MIQIALGVLLGLVLFALLPLILRLALETLKAIGVVALVAAPWLLSELTGNESWLYLYTGAVVAVMGAVLVGALIGLYRWIRLNPKRNTITAGVFAAGIAAFFGLPWASASLGIDHPTEKWTPNPGHCLKWNPPRVSGCPLGGNLLEVHRIRGASVLRGVTSPGVVEMEVSAKSGS